jgi:hypothetical protein
MVGLIARKDNRSNTTQKEEESMSTELTEQQRQILEKEGVPADYEQMTNRQKRYLERADKMMNYLNDKYHQYGVNFVYCSYYPAVMLDRESLYVYPVGGDPELDRVTVERKKGSGDIFEDNYLDVATRPYFEDILNDYISQWFAPEDYRVYVWQADVKNMEVKDLSYLDKKYLQQSESILGSASVYIATDVCTTEKLREFASGYHQWLSENHYYGDQDEWLFTREGINQLTEYNQTENRDIYSPGYISAYIQENEIISEEELEE